MRVAAHRGTGAYCSVGAEAARAGRPHATSRPGLAHDADRAGQSSARGLCGAMFLKLPAVVIWATLLYLGGAEMHRCRLQRPGNMAGDVDGHDHNRGPGGQPWMNGRNVPSSPKRENGLIREVPH